MTVTTTKNDLFSCFGECFVVCSCRLASSSPKSDIAAVTVNRDEFRGVTNLMCDFDECVALELDGFDLERIVGLCGLGKRVFF